MNKRKLIYCAFLAVFTVIFNAYSVSAATNAQNMMVVRHRSANPNSEFISNSFSGLSEKFSMPSFSLSKEKNELSKQSSIAKDSSFSSKPTSEPRSDNSEFSETSFSIHSNAEFSSSPSLASKHNISELSKGPNLSFLGSFSDR